MIEIDHEVWRVQFDPDELLGARDEEEVLQRTHPGSGQEGCPREDQLAIVHRDGSPWVDLGAYGDPEQPVWRAMTVVGSDWDHPLANEECSDVLQGLREVERQLAAYARPAPSRLLLRADGSGGEAVELRYLDQEDSAVLRVEVRFETSWCKGRVEGACTRDLLTSFSASLAQVGHDEAVTAVMRNDAETIELSIVPPSGFASTKVQAHIKPDPVNAHSLDLEFWAEGLRTETGQLELRAPSSSSRRALGPSD